MPGPRARTFSQLVAEWRPPEECELTVRTAYEALLEQGTTADHWATLSAMFGETGAPEMALVAALHGLHVAGSRDPNIASRPRSYFGKALLALGLAAATTREPVRFGDLHEVEPAAHALEAFLAELLEPVGGDVPHAAEACLCLAAVRLGVLDGPITFGVTELLDRARWTRKGKMPIPSWMQPPRGEWELKARALWLASVPDVLRGKLAELEKASHPRASALDEAIRLLVADTGSIGHASVALLRWRSAGMKSHGPHYENVPSSMLRRLGPGNVLRAIAAHEVELPIDARAGLQRFLRESREDKYEHLVPASWLPRVHPPRPAAAASRPQLHFERRAIALGDATTIGRAPECTIAIDHARIAPLQCVIERRGSRFVVTDLEPANRMKVAGAALTAPHALEHLDAIWVGDRALTFDDGAGHLPSGILPLET